MSERSQNGWPVNPPRTARTVPGSKVRLTVADGPAGDVLMYVAGQFDRRVEDIDTARGGVPDDWGHANRPIRGSASVISNHASATAVDLNATQHPLGATRTFTPAQVREIHQILGEVDNVVRWGGDYVGRKDEMHFEIDAEPAEVARVANRLKGTDDVELNTKLQVRHANGTFTTATVGEVLKLVPAIYECVKPGDGWSVKIGWQQASMSNLVTNVLAMRATVAQLAAQLAGVREAMRQSTTMAELDVQRVQLAAQAGAASALESFPAPDLDDDDPLRAILAPSSPVEMPPVGDEEG